MITKNGKRILVPGDRIYCKGIIATIKEITYQDDYGDEGFDCEFMGEDGIYRSWKQRFDGGMVLLPPTPVPMDVLDHVAKYFAAKKPKYKIVDVVRSSEHPEDADIYMVVAENTSEETENFAVWTCWNDAETCLCGGHYNLNDMASVRKVCEEYYHKVR